MRDATGHELLLGFPLGKRDVTAEMCEGNVVTIETWRDRTAGEVLWPYKYPFIILPRRWDT